MTSHRINQLKPYKAPLPIDIRVIRKYTTQWSPTDKPQLFYLLIDADGNTIEAKVQTKRNKLDPHVTLYSCYNIDGYAVDPNIGYRQVVPQTATIVIGDRTVFKSTSELPIPKYYFNFVAYKDLLIMQKQSLLLTDKLQLESTSATTIEVEPPVEAYRESMQKLKRMPKTRNIVYGQQAAKDIRDNITTLQNVVSMNPDSIDNYRFACKAAIKEFHGYRKWYRRKCSNSDCDDTLRPEEDYLLCKHCGRIDNPVYTYCVNGTLDDGTATLSVVFFDNAMTQAIGIDCETMVLKNGYEDPKVIPNPIRSLAGQQKIYSFSMHKNKDASIQRTLEVDPSADIQEVEAIPQRHIEHAPATPAAKISRKHPTDNPGTQESTSQEYNDGGFNLFHATIKDRQVGMYNLVCQLSGHKVFAPSLHGDEEIDNALHLAAKLAPSYRINVVTGAALQMQRELRWFQEVKQCIEPTYKDALNKEGKTPSMVFTDEHKELYAQGQEWMKNSASSCTVVAALIVTMTFAAAFTVPGGNQGDGKPLFVNKKIFMLFIASDAIALFSSTTSVLMFLGILTSGFQETDFLEALPKRLTIGLLSLFISIAATMIAFSSTLALVLQAKVTWIAAPLVVGTGIPLYLFGSLQFPLLVELLLSTYGRSIFH
ncbi:hypothetical protein SSX86_008893 [Deinandra increscens subsp. villosa]|uniref:PGG domain-containing protein n=1 Tax=Deinandra increscens subsp. villosa TaxID=3103831 RepID=A0AAP0DJY1_9ASTR